MIKFLLLAQELIHVIMGLSLAEGVTPPFPCESNSYMDSISIIHPLSGELVPQATRVKYLGSAYNASYITEKNVEFYKCHGVKGQEPLCGSIFDEHILELHNPGDVTILVQICNIFEGCACKAEVTVRCCADGIESDEENEKFAMRNRLDAEFRYWEQSFTSTLDSKSILEYKDILLPSPKHKLSFGDCNYIFGIKSASVNIQQRMNVRSSWMRLFRRDIQSNSICIYFIIGNTTIDKIRHAITSESLIFRDMLLQDDIPVVDSYKTLPYKTTAFMKWVHRMDGSDVNGLDSDLFRSTPSISDLHPPRESFLKYVVMLDDDVFLRVPELLSTLRVSPRDLFYAGEVNILYLLF